MNLKVKEETLKMIGEYRLPTYSEIPNVGLYLEQTAKYINEYLEPLTDTPVTGSMVSNYVKKKLINSPIKKQYYRDQIAKLLIIATLKGVIALDKVNLVLSSFDDEKMEEIYGEFCRVFAVNLSTIFGLVDKVEHPVNEGNNLMDSIIATVVHKIYIDKIILSLEEKGE